MSAPVARHPGLVELHRRRRLATDQKVARQILDFATAEDASFDQIVEKFSHATLRAFRLAQRLAAE
jgi:hypothetical protein